MNVSFNPRNARGYTLLESLSVALIVSLLLIGVVIAASTALEWRKRNALVEEVMEISAAVHDLFGNADSYAGVGVTAIIPKLPSTYTRTDLATGTTIRSPYGEEITVDIDSTQTGAKGPLGVQGVTISTVIPNAACADLVMTLQGSYDYIVLGDVNPTVVANLPVLKPDIDSVVYACNSQIFASRPALAPVPNTPPGPGPTTHPITLYLVRT